VDTDSYLKQVLINDVWGVGRSTAKFLLSYGIRTAYDLQQANADWLRAERGINAWRLVEELRGHSVLPLDFSDAPNKSIMSSRSFGQKISRLEDLHAAIANFVSITARRLRAQELCVREITVMLKPQEWEVESVAASVKLEQASDYTATLIAAARKLTEELYKPGTEYRKAGVILTNLVVNDDLQQSLFTQPKQDEKHSRLMTVLDKLNKQYGRGTLEIASTQASDLWKPKRGHEAEG
jgi:DNA polymerase V